jgi:aspartate-semialdehyde dehydrogenase
MSIRVGILGATGAVGQRLVQLLDPHPDFEIAALTASQDSVGRQYADAAKWRLNVPIPPAVGEMTVRATDPAEIPADVPLLFSSLPSSVGAAVEPGFAEAGHIISSNSSNSRMDADVPLIIPEVNAEHIGLLEVQRDTRHWDGALLKNPNCSTITMVPTLAALDQFGLNQVHVSTLQAVSGAGYSGVSSMEILDNAIPHIGGEEEKMEEESRKLLSRFNGAELALHEIDVSASCNRIATLDGHLENVWAETTDPVTVDSVTAAMDAFPSADLPSSPVQLIQTFEEPDRPQPRLDRLTGGGMAVCAGGFRETTDGIQYNCLSHNTLRGAAGASVLNGELLAREGYL